MPNSTDIKHWLVLHRRTVFMLYACLLFFGAAAVLTQAALRGEFDASPVVGLAMYGLAIFIILNGFPAPNSTHVSWDRITQVGIILVLGPAESALINGLASLSYPLIAAWRDKQALVSALPRALHNCGAFTLIIYASGKAYEAAGGATPLLAVDWPQVFQLLVLVLCVQALNAAFLSIRFAIDGRAGGWMQFHWFVHAVEVPVAAIALLTALVYNNNDAFVVGLFVAFLVIVILIARSLSTVALALKRRIKNLVFLNRIAKRVSASLVLEDLVDVIFVECRRQFKFRYFYFGTYNDQTAAIEFRCIRAHDVDTVPSAGQSTERLAEYVLRTRRSVHLDLKKGSEGNEANRGSALLLEHSNEGSFIGAPVFFGRELLGVVAVHADVAGALAHADFKQLQALVRQTSMAFKNASLFKKLEQHMEGLERTVAQRTEALEHETSKVVLAHRNISILSEIGREITALLDRDEIMASLYRRIHRLTNADGFAVCFSDPGQNGIDTPFVMLAGQRHPSYPAALGHCAALALWSIKHEREILIQDMGREAGRYLPGAIAPDADLLGDWAAQSFICAPVRGKRQVLGALTVHSFHPGAFGQVHLDMVKTLADYAAVALDNANAYLQLK
ncbi:MAG: GAF domain-containing protein [Pseudomonadota bacterium]